MRDPVVGEYLAQVRNPDPFAFPAWRSPVYRTWPWLIMVLATRNRPNPIWLLSANV